MFILLMTALPSALKAATYYVDSVAGNDSSNGTSSDTPWKTLAKVNTPTFQPGDQILFKANGVWSGQLSPKGSGSDGNPIVIDTYGEGSLPLFNGGGLVQNVVYLYNQEYWEIRNLEITNYLEGDTSLKIGVYVLASNVGTVHHIHLKNLVIHDINGNLDEKNNGGIFLEITGSSTPTRFNDLLIEGCYIYNIDRTGISNVSSWDTRSLTTNTNWYPSTNVVIRNNMIERSGNNGLILRVCDGGLIEHNLFRECSLKGTGNAVFPFNCDNTLIQFNEACNTVYNIGDVDASGFDSDYRCKNTIIQYNYSHDNDHGFVLVCCQGGSTRFNDGTIVRYNISQNDGGNIFRISGTTTNTHIYNNIIYVRPGMSSRLIWHKSWEGLPDRTNYYNNIFYNLGNGNYDFDGSTNDVFSHNVFYGNHPSREPNDPNKLTSDPKFVNPGTGGIGLGTVSGYKLQPSSPCVDSGLSIANNGGKDVWGDFVPYNGITDRGAHEYQPAGSDTTPPTPNPMTFATVPYAASCSSITMTASTAADSSGVEYYFACVSGGGHDSGWQYAPTYTDTNLFAGAQYSYTVKARDWSTNQNETAASSPSSAATDFGSSQPTVIFADGFEECFTNWTNNGAYCSGTAYEGGKSCKMDNTEFAEKAISTAGYSGITITYARHTSGLAAGDVFISEWHDGTDWNTIESISGEFSGWTLISDAVLPAGAANNPNFKIRFRAAAATGHYCYVDAVSVEVDTGCVFDTSAPAVPTGLTALGGYGQISLDWNDNLEADLYHYKVYRNLTGDGGYDFIGNADVIQYEDDNVSDGTTYYYVVTVVDASGNESAPSGQANAQTCMTVADFDCNGDVDIDDLSYMVSVWLTTDAKANIYPSDDEVVNLEDLSVFAGHWLK
jgi:hypothetical protein